MNDIKWGEKVEVSYDGTAWIKDDFVYGCKHVDMTSHIVFTNNRPMVIRYVRRAEEQK